MAVYRVNKNRGYTVMANYHLRDKTLSLKAVGLLSKMLSFNDGWQFSTKGLSAICKEGPDAVLAALRELEDHGYLIRHRQRDAKGRMSNTVFEIYEQPQPVSPHRENPDVENPDMENPHGENPAQLNTNQVIKATPHKCNDTHCRIAILWKAIGLPRTFARKSALTQAARQGLSARIRFANANMMLNLAPCFSSPRYRVFRKRSCFLTTPNTCSTFARTEDFACSAFFAAY